MKQTQRHASSIVPVRDGFTSLEFMVALVVLGVALTGVFPLMVVCSRGIESLELRYTAEGNKNGNWYSPVFRRDVTGAGIIPRQDYGTWYVIPSADPWASKLGAVATFSRTAPAVSSLSARVVDDSDPTGYASTGSWTAGTNSQAFRNTYQRHEALALPDVDTAVWTFSNVASGYYYVLVKWPVVSGLATDAAYVIYNGDADASPFHAPLVNQTVAPNSTVYSGWYLLAKWDFTSADKKVKVVLNSNAGGAVVADGVRIVPVSEILSIDKSFNKEEVTVRVRIGP